jgi:hypothetical protein
LTPDKGGSAYSAEFFQFCSRIGATYAVPFASNMSYLHRETFQYNQLLNSSDSVVEYCSHSFRDLATVPSLLLPGESVDLSSGRISQSDWRRDLLSRSRFQVLTEYSEIKSACLRRQYSQEDQATPNRRVIERYFTGVLNACPLPVRFYLGRHIYIQIKSESVLQFVHLDFLSRSLCFLVVPPVFSDSDISALVDHGR